MPCGMGNNDDSISRRKFLEQASATVGAVALGNACSSDESGPDQPMTEAGSGSENRQSSAAGTGGTAGSTPAAGTGGNTGAAGSTPTAGAAGSRPGAGGSGGRTGAAGAGTGGTSSAAGTSGSGGAPAAAGSGGTTPTPPSGKVTVGIVKRANIDEAVARAVELAGGLDAIQPGQTVFIKPNAVSDRAIGTPGIRTSNEVLAAVVKLVKARMPGKIIVGDRSAREFPDTARVFMASGMGAAAMAAGADEIYAAKSPIDAPDEWTLLKPPMYEVTWQAAGGLYAMKKILEADHLINVPTCKNHRFALFSLSMKAFMGAIGDSTRGYVHFASGGTFNAIGRDLAIMNQMFKPTMNIIDATTALVNGGPQGDGADAVRASPGMIFASKDRLAVDAAAVSLIQLELETATVPTPDAANAILKRDAAWKLPQIVNGIERGLGVSAATMVELAFDGIDRAAMIEAKFRA
jgi:uncharacterized protein (DUF362 family)